VGGRGFNFCADEGGKVICNRDAAPAGGWEEFTIEPQGDDKYALIGGQGGKYCSDLDDKMICNSEAAGTNEIFTITPIPA
jgi:hypothetical protein